VFRKRVSAAGFGRNYLIRKKQLFDYMIRAKTRRIRHFEERARAFFTEVQENRRPFKEMHLDKTVQVGIGKHKRLTSSTP